MNIKKITNKLRRMLMRGIIKKIGVSYSSKHIENTNCPTIKKILICRPNHRLGNLLLITPLLQEVIATFPQCEIDLFVKGNLAPIIFANYEHINTIIQLPKKPLKNLKQYVQGWMAINNNNYDLVINVARQSFSGKLSVQLSNSKYKLFGLDDENIQTKYTDSNHVAKYPIYSLRSYLTHLGFPENENKIHSLDLKLSDLELLEGKNAVKTLVNNDKKTICLFTYATGEKCYTKEWWRTFYLRLKREYPNHNIIEILPVENISQLSFEAPNFYSKDIRKIGAVIANTEAFIGADSGIMHLASSVKTPTVGLFSVTDVDAFQPYNHSNLGIDTNSVDTEACIAILNKIVTPDFAESCIS